MSVDETLRFHGRKGRGDEFRHGVQALDRRGGSSPKTIRSGRRPEISDRFSGAMGISIVTIVQVSQHLRNIDSKAIHYMELTCLTTPH